MAQLQLWYAPGACSLAAHIVLREAGLEFKAIEMSVGANNGLPESFRSINRKMRIPVLRVDDQNITELPAILTAISMQVPQRHFLGSTDLEIVRTYEWMAWLSGTLHGQGFGGLWRSHRFVSDPALYASIKERAAITIRECLSEIEDRLGSAHAFGNAFTVVDAYLLVFWRWGGNIGLDMEGTYPRFSALGREVLHRESTKAALEAERIGSRI